MSLLLLGNKKKKDIVKSGLMLWLDARDFLNSPASTTWKDRSGVTRNYNCTNIALNGDFALDSNSDGIADEWIAYNTLATRAVINNQQTYTPSTINCGVRYNYQTASGDKMYVCASIKTESGARTIAFGINRAPWDGCSPALTDVYKQFSFAYIGTGIVDSIVIQEVTSTGLAKVYIKEFYVYNLTAIFGAGNEPSVAWCDANLKFTATSGVMTANNNAIATGFAFTNTSGSDNNGGIVFDGFNDKFTVNGVGDDSTFTVEAKFIMSSYASNKPIIAKAGDGSTGARFVIDTAGGGTKLRFFGYNTSNTVVGDIAGIAINANVIVFGTFVYDGTNLKMYINGVLQQSIAIVGILKSISNNFNIGNRATVEYFDKTIFLVRYYNRVLTDAEILKNYIASR